VWKDCGLTYTEQSNLTATMAGEDREEEEQGTIRKVNMLSYFSYQFTGKKISKYLMSNQLVYTYISVYQ